MDIVMSANNNEQVMVFPIVPEIDVSKPQENEEFKTINNGTINLIGDLGLKEFSISSIFPCNPYRWLRPGSSSNGFEYISFIDKYRALKYPFRVIASRKDGTTWFNIPMTVEDFDYRYRRNGDIEYTLRLKEYRFVKVK